MASCRYSPVSRRRFAAEPAVAFNSTCPLSVSFSNAANRSPNSRLIPPVDGCIPGLDDSKKLTEKKREALFDVICQQAAAWAVASVSAEEIDATDILSARMKAMQLAINALAIPADYALIDGNRDHGRSAAITTPHETVVGGDGRSASIAAASVLAKVSRDRYVCRVLDSLYPQYQFAKHKGYGTKLHYAMLDQYGPCPEHRMSFLTKWKERRT